MLCRLHPRQTLSNTHVFVHVVNSSKRCRENWEAACGQRVNQAILAQSAPVCDQSSIGAVAMGLRVWAPGHSDANRYHKG